MTSITAPRAELFERFVRGLAGLSAASSLYAMTLAVASCAMPLQELPPPLQPTAQETLSTIVSAEGVQIYQCRAAAGADPAWAFVAPDAKLRDVRGTVIGHHGAGPHWTAADGSRIVATVQQRVDAPYADAIPWLLLKAQSQGAEGRFGNVTSVLRVNTAGGIAPPRSGCSVRTAGRTERVPYTADYHFYRMR